MKNVTRKVFLFLLVCTTMIMPQAFAQENYLILPSDFSPLNMLITEDDRVVLSGYTGMPQESCAAILQITKDGKMQLIEGEPIGAAYTQAAVRSPEQLLLLFKKWSMATDTTAILMDNETNILKMQTMEGVTQVFTISDGCLFLKRAAVGNGILLKQNNDGQLIWQIELPQMSMINSIVEDKGDIYLIGDYSTNSEQNNMGVILKINETGQVIWRYDSPEEGTFYWGMVTDQNDEIVIAGMYYDCSSEPVEKPMIAKIYRGNIIWQNNDIVPKQTVPLDFHPIAAAAHTDGYYIAYQMLSESGFIYVSQFDDFGQCLNTWKKSVEPIHLVAQAQMKLIDGQFCLIVKGYNRQNFDECILLQLSITQFP